MLKTACCKLESTRLIVAVSTILVVGSLALTDDACADRDSETSQVANTTAKLPFALVKNPSMAAADEPIPLPPRRSANAVNDVPTEDKSNSAITTVISSLAIVLGLFAMFVWFTKRTQRNGAGSLPNAAVETLGRVPLNAKQEMHLVRIGNKLLLLAVTANTAETLTEITDPAEIERLSGLCQHSHAGGLGSTFRDVLSHLTTDGERYASAGRNA